MIVFLDRYTDITRGLSDRGRVVLFEAEHLRENRSMLAEGYSRVWQVCDEIDHWCMNQGINYSLMWNKERREFAVKIHGGATPALLFKLTWGGK